MSSLQSGMSGQCIVCKQDTKQRCSRCNEVYYCSKEHQKTHWKQHKQLCSPVSVKEDRVIGRYMEAVKDIRQYDIIIKEEPLISGPAQITPPVCLGCYNMLMESEIYECDKCGWPFCSKQCSNSPNHIPECYFTEGRGQKVKISTYEVIHPNYQCITILRCLYQRDHDKNLWNKLIALKSHCEERKDSPKWNSEKMIAKFIIDFFKLSNVFSEDEIMKCNGIVQINGHEVPLAEPGYVAVYNKLSMIEHSCVANCSKSFTNTGGIVLSAGVPIKSGTPLSVCYTDPLWGTDSRRYHLAETKFFECSCKRCSDPTEFGTMFNAVKCQKSECQGYLLPETFLTPILNKLHKTKDQESKSCDKIWYCNVCKNSVNDNIIQQMIEDIGKELNSMPKGKPEVCEKFIEHCSKYLHPSHYYITDVSIALAHLIGGDDQQGLANINDDRLKLKLQLCYNLTNLLNVLIPGDCRVRGTILFEYHAVVAEQGRRLSLQQGPAVMFSHLVESKKYLSECMKLLQHECDVLPEGKIYNQACINMRELDKIIERISYDITTSTL